MMMMNKTKINKTTKQTTTKGNQKKKN